MLEGVGWAERCLVEKLEARASSTDQTISWACRCTLVNTGNQDGLRRYQEAAGAHGPHRLPQGQHGVIFDVELSFVSVRVRDYALARSRGALNHLDVRMVEV